MSVGTKIDVGEVVSKSTELLMANPAIILIQVIPAIPSLVGDIFGGSSVLSPVYLLTAIISGVIGIIASGAYPPVVKEALAGQRLTIGQAFGHAYRRFWSLLAAAILVGLVVGLGFIALIVPGILFLTWYAYTVPAIMLENKGALEGMSASKAFGRDKKWSTFLLFLVFLLAYVVLAAIGAILALGGGGRVIQTLLTIPLSAWTAVVVSYAYIAHGLPATPTEPPELLQQPPSGTPAPPVFSPGSTTAVGAGRFCSNCGSPLAADAKFCPSCGRPV